MSRLRDVDHLRSLKKCIMKGHIHQCTRSLQRQTIVGPIRLHVESRPTY